MVVSLSCQDPCFHCSDWPGRHFTRFIYSVYYYFHFWYIAEAPSLLTECIMWSILFHVLQFLNNPAMSSSLTNQHGSHSSDSTIDVKHDTRYEIYLTTECHGKSITSPPRFTSEPFYNWFNWLSTLWVYKWRHEGKGIHMTIMTMCDIWGWRKISTGYVRS